MSGGRGGPRWDRRQVLKGLSLGAGALVLSPLLRAFRAEAMDRPAIGPRVVFVVEGCGWPTFPRLRADQTAGRGEEVIATADFAFGPALKSLEPLRKSTLLVDGLANLQGVGTNGNHTGEYMALSCRALDHGPGGITIDRHLAAQVGQATPIDSLLLGVVGDASVTLSASTSADGARQPVPLQCSPRLAWRDVFGSVAGDAGGQASAFEEQALVDYLTDDLGRARAALAPTERHKLDEYVAALEGITRRRRLLAGRADLASCAPSATAPVDTYVDRLAAQMELAAAALICGLTRVVVVGAGAGYPHYGSFVSGAGLTLDKHSLAHGQVDPGGATIADVNDLHAAHIARLVEMLAAAPEGNGTIFDQTVIVYLNDNGNEHHARYLDWPVALVGTAGGRLRADGRYLRFPSGGMDRSRSLGELWNTLCHAMGAPKDDFGSDGNEPSRGPIPEILA